MDDIDDRRRRSSSTSIVAIVALVVLALLLFFVMFRPGAETPVDVQDAPDVDVEINPPAPSEDGGESGGEALELEGGGSDTNAGGQ